MRFLLTLAAISVCWQSYADVNVLESGEAAEIRSLAVRFEHGEGVPKDQLQAHGLYCLAAMRGDSEALYALGWMYANGRGVERDDALAAYWLKQAARRGISGSESLLDRLERKAADVDPKCPHRIGRQASLKSQVQALIRILAPEFGLDPDLVLAVVKTESNFEPTALSPKGAQGLMQLVPATARRFGVRDPWDPTQNLLGGMAYLTWLVTNFDGDLDKVLAAYNAGEEAVAHYGGIPPYTETILYVQRIKGLYGPAREPFSPERNVALSILLPSWVRASLGS